MGLSKKLGGLKSLQMESQEVAYQWSHQMYTLHDIIHKFKLPCVVQCATVNPCSVLWSDFQFDLRQPLLLYSTRSVQKVHAVSLQEDVSRQHLEELKPPLAIPSDFEGWFGARPKGVEKFKRHRKIDDVANSKTSRFLVTTGCSGFLWVKAGGRQYFKDRDILPGEVMRKMTSVYDKPVGDAFIKLIKDHGPCLACTDEKDDDIFIPLATEAVCYELAEGYPETGEQVFRISSLVDCGNSRLPRVLQLVYGDPPALSYSFTGMLRCYSVFTEETIMAAILDPSKSTCLELTTDSCAKFRLALNESILKKTVEYLKAHQACSTLGTKFLSGIKVSFTLRPLDAGLGEDSVKTPDNDANDTDTNGSDTQEANDSDTVDTSDTVETSDILDVNADSEFDIEWGSEAGETIQHSYNFKTNNESVTNVSKSIAPSKHYLNVDFCECSNIDVDSSHPKKEHDYGRIITTSVIEKVDDVTASEKNAETNVLAQRPVPAVVEADVHCSFHGEDRKYDKGNPLLYLFPPFTNKNNSITSDDNFSGSETAEEPIDLIRETYDQTLVCRPTGMFVNTDANRVDIMQSEYNPENTKSCLNENETENSEISSSETDSVYDEDSADRENPKSAQSFMLNNLFNAKEYITSDEDAYRDDNSDGFSSPEVTGIDNGRNSPAIEEYIEGINSDSDTGVEEILSLAMEESEKLSTLTDYGTNMSGNGFDSSADLHRSTETRALLNGSVGSDLHKSQESVARFNSLIDEVTTIVNTSSSRIISACNRKQKHRNRLPVPKPKSDVGYVELVSSTETIPDSMSAATQKTFVQKALKPANSGTKHQDQDALVHSRSNGDVVIPQTFEEHAMIISSLKNIDRLNLLPKANSTDHLPKSFGMLKRSRGQLNMADPFSSIVENGRLAALGKGLPKEVTLTEQHSGEFLKQHKSFYQDEQSEIDFFRPITSSNSFPYNKRESLKQVPLTLDSEEGDLSVTSIAIYPTGHVADPYRQNIHHLSEDDLTSDQDDPDQYWI